MSGFFHWVWTVCFVYMSISQYSSNRLPLGSHGELNHVGWRGYREFSQPHTNNLFQYWMGWDCQSLFHACGESTDGASNPTLTYQFNTLSVCLKPTPPTSKNIHLKLVLEWSSSFSPVDQCVPSGSSHFEPSPPPLLKCPTVPKAASYWGDM